MAILENLCWSELPEVVVMDGEVMVCVSGGRGERRGRTRGVAIVYFQFRLALGDIAAGVGVAGGDCWCGCWCLRRFGFRTCIMDSSLGPEMKETRIRCGRSLLLEWERAS